LFGFLTGRSRQMQDHSAPALRLLVQDAEDLAVISAHMQDAVVRVGDMGFQPKSGLFALVGFRFDWLAAAEGRKERCHVGLHFERVLKASHKGIDQAHPETTLSLLGLVFTPTEAPAGVVELVFSGGAAVRLEVECLEGQLRDLGPRWQTSRQPGHAEVAEPQSN
jgi:hypothetical protein